MGQRTGPYQELRRPVTMHGGEWRITKLEPWESSRIAEKVVKGLRSDLSDSKGIRVHLHRSDGLYLGRVDIPKGASAGRIADAIEKKSGGLPVVATADQCGRGWDDTDDEDGRY